MNRNETYQESDNPNFQVSSLSVIWLLKNVFLNDEKDRNLIGILYKISYRLDLQKNFNAS